VRNSIFWEARPTFRLEFSALLIEGMIFFEKGRIHAPSRKKSYLDSATPNFLEAIVRYLEALRVKQ
jgi:hypothetical protein